MPPKPKFTKEEVVEVALELVGEKGLAALTARELGSGWAARQDRFSPCSETWRS